MQTFGSPAEFSPPFNELAATGHYLYFDAQQPEQARAMPPLAELAGAVGVIATIQTVDTHRELVIRRDVTPCLYDHSDLAAEAIMEAHRAIVEPLQTEEIDENLERFGERVFPIASQLLHDRYKEHIPGGLGAFRTSGGGYSSGLFIAKILFLEYGNAVQHFLPGHTVHGVVEQVDDQAPVATRLHRLSLDKLKAELQHIAKLSLASHLPTEEALRKVVHLETHPGTTPADFEPVRQAA